MGKTTAATAGLGNGILYVIQASEKKAHDFAISDAVLEAHSEDPCIFLVGLEGI